MQTNHRVRAVAVLVATAGVATLAMASPFTANNIAVSQVTASGFLTSTQFNAQAGAVQVREFGLSSPLVGAFNGNNIALASAAGDPTRLTLSASATSEGHLTLAYNSSSLSIIGYNQAAGVASPVGTSIGASTNNGTVATDVRRVVGRIDLSGAVAYNQMTNAYSASNARSTTSRDGSVFITGGTAGTTNNQGLTGGVRSFDPSMGTNSTQMAASPTNVRNVNLGPDGNTVFFSSASSPFVGVNVIQGGVASLLPGFSAVTGLSSYDFWFRDGQTLYVADDGSLTGQGGLQKWLFNSTSGNWELSYRITAGLSAGLRALAGTVDASGNVILYATTGETVTSTLGNNLVGIIDSGSGSTFTTLATSAAGTAFRGVDFTPGTALVPAPGALGLLTLGGLVAARRRRA